ncbi:MAG TPA: hypothetical protein VGD88_05725, partial [Opitutaceae bacterium]
MSSITVVAAGEAQDVRFWREADDASWPEAGHWPSPETFAKHDFATEFAAGLSVPGIESLR